MFRTIFILLCCCAFLPVLAVDAPDALVLNGATLVSVRPLAAWAGMEMSYTAESGKLTLTRGEASLTLTIGETAVVSSSDRVQLSVPPLEIGGVIYVPLVPVVGWLHGIVTLGEGADYTETVRHPDFPEKLVLPLRRQALLASGDFDGDGQQEMACAVTPIARQDVQPNELPAASISVLKNHRAVWFTNAADATLGLIFTSMVARDVDGDGRLDMAINYKEDDATGLLAYHWDGRLYQKLALPVALRVNGKTVIAHAPKPPWGNDCYLLPLSFLARWLGATVSEHGRQITVTAPDKTIILTPDNAQYTINSKPAWLPFPPVRFDGSIYVHANFFAEFGAHWSSNTAHNEAVTITHPTTGEKLTCPVTGYLDTAVANLDGDKIPERVYTYTRTWSLSPTIGNDDITGLVWIVKDGKTRWEKSFNGENGNYGNFDLLMRLTDLTGDGHPEVVLAGAWFNAYMVAGEYIVCHWDGQALPHGLRRGHQHRRRSAKLHTTRQRPTR